MRYLKIPMLLFAMLFSSVCLGYSVGGVHVPESAKLSDGTTPLKLQGAGIRTKFLFDVYVGAFYAEGVVRSPVKALSLPGSKRMWFHFMREVGSGQMREAMEQGIEANNTNAVISQYQHLLNQFYDLFDKKMYQGDIMTIDYVPGKGTVLSYNGRVRGAITGEHFYSLVLSVWMGEHPPSQKFQRALLSF